MATIQEHLAGFLAAPAGTAGLRAGLRGWIGLVEALALDWIEHRDLGRDALVALATRAIRLIVQDAGLTG